MGLVFHLEDKLVIKARYSSSSNSDYIRPQDFSFSHLEEFHCTKELENLLKSLQEAVKLRELKQKEITEKKWDDEHKGKFTIE